MFDIQNHLKALHSIYPASLSGAKTGDAIIDLANFNGALIVCYSGAITTDTVFQLMHGNDAALSDAAAVPDADLIGTEPTLLQATDNECKTFGYKGTKRYLRVDTTAGAGIAGAIIVKGLPRHLPTS